jgi:ribosomal-protein-alanine N-acetyltransferase
MSNVSYTLRDYRPEDFLALWDLDQSCFSFGIAYTQYELRSYMRRPGAFTLIAQEVMELNRPGLILGFIIAECSRGAGHVITIDVRSRAQRQKVGSTLLRSAEARMKASRCAFVRLETAVNNVVALGFYKAHSYDVVKVIPRYYSNGVDALLLEKTLGPSDHTA